MTAWNMLFTIPYFYAVKRFGRLRVAPIYEIIGLDVLMHEEFDKLGYISEKSIKILEHQKKQRLEKEQRRLILNK